MQYTKPDAPVRKFFDLEPTSSVNRRRYQNPNAQVLINPQGRPIAFRHVRVLQPGTFAGASRLQAIRPDRVVSLSRSVYDAFRARCHPLN